jgi:HPt (histidine-containing phosphotransfer) domain-containing protein
MTASVLEKDREATSAAGMEGFAPKPVDLHVLGRELAMVLGLAVDEEAQDAGEDTLLQALNHTHALHRWAGEERAYHRALGSFAAERAHAIGELRQRAEDAAAAAAPAEAAALAHQLKGAAGNLGLEQLAAALDRLEHAWRDSPAAPPGAAAPLLDAAEQRLEEAIAAIGALLAAAAPAASAPPAAAAAPEPAPLDEELVRRLGATLHRSIDSGAFDEATMDQLAQALALHVAPQRLQELRQAIDDFDFSAAHARLEALLASCLPATAGSTP